MHAPAGCITPPAFEASKVLQVDNEGQLRYIDPEPWNITFHNDDEEVCKMYIHEETGRLEVEGDMNYGAQLFFEQFLRGMCDQYIEKAKPVKRESSKIDIEEWR